MPSTHLIHQLPNLISFSHFFFFSLCKGLFLGTPVSNQDTSVLTPLVFSSFSSHWAWVFITCSLKPYLQHLCFLGYFNILCEFLILFFSILQPFSFLPFLFIIFKFFKHFCISTWSFMVSFALEDPDLTNFSMHVFYFLDWLFILPLTEWFFDCLVRKSLQVHSHTWRCKEIYSWEFQKNIFHIYFRIDFL